MADIAKDLKERFDYVAYFFLSAWEHDPEAKIVGNTIVRDKGKEDAEDRVIDTFEKLRDSADAIPPTVIEKTEELHSSIGPKNYEALLVEAIQNVGRSSLPSNANEFLEALNLSLQNSANAIPCVSDRIQLVRS